MSNAANADTEWIFLGPGQMPALCRGLDWSKTKLGTVVTWPQSLRTAAQTVLASPFPAILLWGPDLIQIYNEGYQDLMGNKHPAGLGQATQQCWPEVWHINQPLYQRVWAGESFSFADALYPITRTGSLKDAWFTLAYSPVRQESGDVGGVLVTVFETTDRVLEQRQRTQAQQALRQQELHTRLAVEAAGLATWEWDLVTDQVYWNEQHFRLLGMPIQPNPLPADAFMRHLHPDDADSVKAQLNQTITQRTLYDTEFRVVRDDGITRWMSGYGQVTKENDGQPSWMSGIMFDITNRRATQEALRQSEENFRLLIQASSDSVYKMNADWTQMQQLIGKKFLADTAKPSSSWLQTYILPQDQEPVQQTIQAAIHTKSPFELEHRVRRADGSVGWTFSRAIPVLDEQGAIREWLGAASDITPRKQAAAALYQSEAWLRAILDSANDYAIFTTDLNQQVTSWNGGAQALFGYAEADILHRSVALLYNPQDRQQGVPRMEAQTAIRVGRFDNERWHSRADGSLFYGSGVVTPLRDEAGSIVGLLKVMRDLTAQKRAEEALQEADRRKDEFLAMLAHELRNPMSTIRSGLQILTLTLGEDAMPNATVAASTVAMMNRQTDHLVRMVDDLLDVSRISGGKIELKNERVNLVAIVRQALEAAQSLYQQSGRQLHASLPAGPIYLKGDATRLTQVVNNLLTNGARYTGEGGQVWLSLKQRDGSTLDGSTLDGPTLDGLTLGGPLDGDEAILEVRDNGIGLAADQLSAIFELFVQVDNSTARSKGGLGLGLTLVKRLVEKHGGRVQAQSAGLGQGSTFTVHLPTLTTAAESSPNPTFQATDPAIPQRVLVVDDNADAALTLVMLLQLKGYEAHSRTSGRAGIEAAEALRPSAILLDIGMPDLDGYATCGLIREQVWGRDVVIIALTGYGQEEDRQRTKESGFNGHLVKPVDLGALTNLLTDLLPPGQPPSA